MVLSMDLLKGNDFCNKENIERYYYANNSVLPCFGSSDEIIFYPDGKVFCTMNAKDRDSIYYYFGFYEADRENITCFFDHQYAYNDPSFDMRPTPRYLILNAMGKLTGLNPGSLKFTLYIV